MNFEIWYYNLETGERRSVIENTTECDAKRRVNTANEYWAGFYFWYVPIFEVI